MYTEVLLSMFKRFLHRHPFPLPKPLASAVAPLALEHVSHTLGQAAAIRFFDPDSLEDLTAMREILAGKQVKRYMDDTAQISQTEYREWAGDTKDTSYLFAVLDARNHDPEEMKHVRGFVYIYSEREEKFRVKRMEKDGLLTPSNRPRYVLEISFAARPLKDGEQRGSGLMGSGVRQACLQVQMLLTSPDQPEVEIFAFVSPTNEAAQRTLLSSGFVQRGMMKYDPDSPREDYVYFLDWKLLKKKVRQKLLELIQAQERAV